MKPNEQFVGLEKTFWAHVRSISERIGYTDRGTKEIKIPTIEELAKALEQLSLSPKHLWNNNGSPSSFGNQLHSYFVYRAHALNKIARPLLMDKHEAEALFNKVRKQLKSKIPIPMNKQKGDKKKPAYLTAIVNMLVNAHRGDFPCDVDPRQLTSVTHEGMPVRTLARRIDGAFPRVINPVAIWEVKEYYYTTTFGSRVADGVYETLLDGMELEELSEKAKIRIRHYLILDDKFTWWQCGRSYLCRVVDMMHMGYVDEVLFGREVVDRLPVLVGEWISLAQRQNK
jgi:hypothetical protein